MDERSMAFMRVAAAAAEARRRALAAAQEAAQTVRGTHRSGSQAAQAPAAAATAPAGLARALPPLPLPPRLPPGLLPDRLPWQPPPIALPGQAVSETPVDPYGPLVGANVAAQLARPTPLARGPVFASDIGLDPSQVEDRRAERHPHPGPRPELPWWAPWLQDEYRQRLAEWQQAQELWQWQQPGAFR